MENVGNDYHGLYLLVGLRTREPQICHLGILNMLNWSWMRKKNGRSKKVILTSPFSPETGQKTLLWEMPPYILRKGTSLFLKTKGCWDQQTGLANKFPQFALDLRSSDLHTSTVQSPPKQAWKYSGFFIWVFISLQRLLCHVKCILNNYIHVFLLLIFVSLIFRPSWHTC